MMRMRADRMRMKGCGWSGSSPYRVIHFILSGFSGKRCVTFAPPRARPRGRRKELYEYLHPETKHGENQHTRSRQVGESSTTRFTADTAVRTGQSERTVQRDAVARGPPAEGLSERFSANDPDNAAMRRALANRGHIGLQFSLQDGV